jgi:hypothetical protein
MKTLIGPIIALCAASLSAQTSLDQQLKDLLKMNAESDRHQHFGTAKCVIELDKDTPEYVVEMLCGPADKRTGELGAIGDRNVWRTTSVYRFDNEGFVIAGYANGKLFVVVSSKNIAGAIKQGTFFKKGENPPGTAFSLVKSLEGDQ